MENFKILKKIEQKVLWLSCWMIHNANHIREILMELKLEGIKQVVLQWFP